FRARAAFDARNAELAAAGQPMQDAAAFEAAWERDHPTPATPLSAVRDQIDYGVQLVAVDRVGSGPDVGGGGGALADGLRSVADFASLVAGVQARGYSDADIRKILGGNLLRVWRDVEAGAQPR